MPGSQNVRLQNLESEVAALKAQLLSQQEKAQIFSALGTFVKYGCKVTEGSASPLDMTIRLQGQASGDSSYLNPDVAASPTRFFQYANIGGTKGGAFYSNDTTATVETAPAAGTARYDIAYIFAGRDGAGFQIAEGTPSAAVLTDFGANGLQTQEYATASPNYDPTLPVGAVPVARIYVAPEVTAITNSVIADLRSFQAPTALQTAISNAEEWANKAEDSLVSAGAGGDQVDDYSALHHANKADASATAAAGSATSAANSAASAAEIVNIDDVAIYANPRALAQAIHMTAASSGSNGIQVADDDNLNQGTNSFTLHRELSLPSWTPAAQLPPLVEKDGNGHYYLNLLAGGTLQVQLNDNVTNSVFNSTVQMSEDAGLCHDITATIDVGAVNTTVTLYVDGIPLGDPVVNASVGSIDNTSKLYFSGGGNTRTGSVNQSGIIFNRALSAAEVLDLSLNGIAEADKRGSQENLGSAPKNFNSWIKVNVTVTADDTTDPDGGSTADKVAENSSTGSHYVGNPASVTVEKGKRYKTVVYGKASEYSWFQVTYDTAGFPSTAYVNFDVTNGVVGNQGAGIESAAIESVGSGWYKCEVVVIATGSGGGKNYLGLLDNTDTNSRLPSYTGDGASGIFLWDAIEKQLGATLALEPEGIDSSLQWEDSSGNNLHAMLPAAGATPTRRVKEFTIRSTHTWDGTHEAQYVGGVNQSILPDSAWIESIVGDVTGATVEDIIIGDGSDTDRFVALTTGLATGVQAFTIANNTHDGTNKKMVIDPDAAFTGSISLTIRGYIYED